MGDCESSVQVEVRLYGEFAKSKGSLLALAIEPGSTVRQVTRALGLPPEELGPVFVDGRYAKLSKTLSGGERVGIFPRDMSLVYIYVSYEAQEGPLAYVPQEDEPGLGQEKACR